MNGVGGAWRLVEWGGDTLAQSASGVPASTEPRTMPLGSADNPRRDASLIAAFVGDPGFG